MNIDKRILKMIIMVVGGFVLFFIIIALISSCNKNKKYTFEELEQKLITLAQNYYERNEASLPDIGKETSLTTGYFISNGYFKDITLTTGETCTGEIIVANNNNNYLYTPKLTCGNKKSVFFADKLIEDNNVVTTGEGLYHIGNEYIYRGEKVKNYISINEKLWRIIKINSDKTIRIIEVERSGSSTTWDNRYNLEKKSNSGINDFITNNINSRIKNKLEDLYNNENKFGPDIKPYFVPQNLCIGKRSENDTVNDGSIECSQVLENQMFGLIQVNEYFFASLDENCINIASKSCTNYNYLAKLDASTWTITADKDSSYKAYRLDYDISLVNASSTGGISIVAHLSKNLLFVSGTGTEEDPYIIK